MLDVSDVLLSEKEKNEFIDALTPELPMLRAKAEISQECIANLIGISRQSYGAIERKARIMSWNTYLSLILFYDYNIKTHKIIRNISAFPHKLIKRFNGGEEPSEFDMGMLFQADSKQIIDTLDEQAFLAIKTVLMFEYSRCNNLPADVVVKFFEGINLNNKEITDADISTIQALKNIKENKANDK